MAAAWFWLWVQAAAVPGLGASRIIGGQVVSTCSFPSAVMLGLGSKSLCSGSLIHPQIVLYAAHCTDDVAAVYFGEDISRGVFDTFQETQPARKIALAPGACRLYPGHDPSNGSDFAYCRLPQPVSDVPIVPVLMGCEAQILSSPQQVVVVGFGYDEAGVLGVKRTTTTTANQVSSNKVQLGSKVNGTRPGDSGGPAYVRLSVGNGAFPGGDGTWRQFGVDSYGLSAGPSPSVYGLATNALAWIEADSGLDLTPCGSAAGTWAPGPACGNFPTQLSGAGGTWATGCSLPSAPKQYSSTCGPAFGAASPEIELQAPADGERVAEGDAHAQVICRVAFDAADPNNQVIALLDGAPLSPIVASGVPPAPVAGYAFGPVAWTAGSHMVSCRADDTRGLSTTYNVVLNVAAGLGPGPGSGAGTGDSSDANTVAVGDGGVVGTPASPTQVAALGAAPLSPIASETTSANGCQAAGAGGASAAPWVALWAWRRRQTSRRRAGAGAAVRAERGGDGAGSSKGSRAGSSVGSRAGGNGGSSSAGRSGGGQSGRGCGAGWARRQIAAAGVVARGCFFGLCVAVLGACGVNLGVGGSGAGQTVSTASSGSDADGALVGSRGGATTTAATAGSGSTAGDANALAGGALLSVQVVSTQIQTQNPNDVASTVGGIAAATPLPDASSSIAGTVMGESVPSGDVLFEFAFDPGRQNSLAMFLFLTDAPASCSRHVNNPNQPLAPSTRTLRLELINLNTGEDQPFRGTYQVFNPQAAPTPAQGNLAMATYVVADGACGNRLPAQNAWATGGQVTINTHVTAAGVYLSGQLSKLTFGSQNDVIDGGFVARGCLTSWAPIDLRTGCR